MPRINTLFRESDAEQRSYSLFQRLRQGRFLFAFDTLPHRHIGRLVERNKTHEVPNEGSWGDAWADAAHVVYDNLPLKAYYTSDSSIGEMANESPADLNRKKLHNPADPMNHFITAGMWNPFALFERFTLAWVNWATDRHNPLSQETVDHVQSYVHITVASAFNAIAKTLNLVASPLLVLGLALAAMNLNYYGTAFATVPWLAVIPVILAIPLIVSVAYNYRYYLKYYEEDAQQLEDGDAFYPPAMALGASVLHAGQSLILGALNPIFRVAQRTYYLAKTNPALAVAAVTGVALALFTVIALPLLPIPTLQIAPGFELGTIISNQLGSALSVITQPLNMSTFGQSLFSLGVSVMTGIGLADLVTRGAKTVAEIKDDKLGEEYVTKAGITSYVDLATGNATNVVFDASYEEKDDKGYHLVQYQNHVKDYGSFGRHSHSNGHSSSSSTSQSSSSSHSRNPRDQRDALFTLSGEKQHKDVRKQHKGYIKF